MALPHLRGLLRAGPNLLGSTRSPIQLALRPAILTTRSGPPTSSSTTPNTIAGTRSFSATAHRPSQTFNQIKRGNRVEQKARRSRSPALAWRPQMKGVCLRVFIMSPRKPNSGERKIARVRLSSGKVVNTYIPGEGHNIQQHSVVLVRGGRAPDCPGIKYHLVRGTMDLLGVSNRITSRSKYGTKKPKTAS